MAVVRALFTAHISESLTVRKGDLWDADDLLVKVHPDWFSDDLSEIVHRSVKKPEPPVETATAEPGEKRRTTKSA